MEIKKVMAVAALAITLFIFVTILLVGNILDNKRVDHIDAEFANIQSEFRNMETLFLMSEFYDDKMACLAFEEKIKDLDSTLWKLGERLDKYREATEEFYKSEYYKRQKQIFNENQVFYYLLMKKMIEQCEIDKSTILFFYADSTICRQCDDQSFILSDINQIDYEKGKQDIAIFPLDTDLNITTINLLYQYYNVTELPCIIIDEEKFCGIRGKQFIMEEICERNNIYFCELYEKEYKK